jgi:lipopolysaccharide export system protein LptA
MSRQYYRSSIPLLVLSAVLLSGAGGGSLRPDSTAREPIVITAQRMEAEKLGDKVSFYGDVTLKKENMTLSSDRMVVFYDPRSKDVRQIDAHGNVTVRKDIRVAYSNDASYFSREEKIVLTGDARIIENENRLGGKKITIFMRDDRSLVEGGNVLLYPENTGKPADGRLAK